MNPQQGPAWHKVVWHYCNEFTLCLSVLASMCLILPYLPSQSSASPWKSDNPQIKGAQKERCLSGGSPTPSLLPVLPLASPGADNHQAV